MNKYILLNKDLLGYINDYSSNYNDRLDFFDINGNSLKGIGSIKRVNLLVGVNNSGKSRFLRLLIRNIFNSLIYLEKNEVINQSIEKRLEIFKSTYNQYYNNKINDILLSVSKENYLKKIELLINYSENIVNKNIQTEVIKSLRKILDDYFEKKNPTNHYYYIPILRGIENFDKYFSDTNISNVQLTKNDLDQLEKYKNQAREIYSLKTEREYSINKVNIFSGEDFYNQVVDILLGDEIERDKFHEFENFISDNFYDGEGFKINANKNKKCLMVKIRNDKEYEIYHLGDGIKQLIVILYPMFIHKNEEYSFYIEEPEINLHPGFQRKLMELLMSDVFKNHTFYINTHSNHIIDIINDYEDVTIFKFSKSKNMTINQITNDNVTILNELGIRSSSVFLSNCTIWVEGISDRIYLKKYLEMYLANINMENIYKENIHYSFVEYQGNNITHWNFDSDIESNELINANWLSHNIFLIVDNDDASSKPNSKKNIRHNILSKILGNNFYKLKSREMENLISLTILEKMLMKDNGINELHRKKYNSSSTIRFYSQETISNQKTYMGEFIENTYDNLIHRYKTDTAKTIKNKAEFAKKICDEIKSWDDLTEEAQNLTKKIFDFIKNNNLK